MYRLAIFLIESMKSYDSRTPPKSYTLANLFCCSDTAVADGGREKGEEASRIRKGHGVEGVEQSSLPSLSPYALIE